MEAFQKHGLAVKKKIHRVVKRGTDAVYRIERKVLTVVKERCERVLGEEKKPEDNVDNGGRQGEEASL